MPGLGVPGTTTEEMQRMIAADYRTAGIVDGCKVSGTSGMSYSISAGAVIIDTGTDMAIKVAVAAQTVPTTAAPATGSRTDTIYVVQEFPTANNPAANSYVAVTSGSVPANAIVIDRRNVPAGVTATTATTSVHNRKYALPIGGSLGRLHLAIDTNESPHNSSALLTRGAGRFYVPTDRDVEFNMVSTVSMSDSGGFTPDQYWNASVIYKFYVDGQLVKSWEREYSRIWDSRQLSFVMALSEGTHDVYYTVQSKWIPDLVLSQYRYWAVRYGGSQQYNGDQFRVYDRGVINW